MTSSLRIASHAGLLFWLACLWTPASLALNSDWRAPDPSANLAGLSGADGYTWQGSDFYGPGLEGHAWAVVEWDDGEGSALYVAGRFLTAGGRVVNGIARFDNGEWSPLGEGFDVGLTATAYDLVVYDGDLIAAGSFTQLADGTPVNGIARWDGNEWQPLDSGISGGFGNVYSLLVYGNELIVGGSFEQAGDTPAINIARWNGSQWSAVSGGIGVAGAGASVWTLAEFEGELVAGGYFILAGGQQANGIARWNFADGWRSLGAGVADGPQAVTGVQALVEHQGSLVVGGSFTRAGNSPANYVARWDGSQWSSMGEGFHDSGFGPVDDFPNVRTLGTFQGDVIAGGMFLRSGDTLVNHIARWDGSTWVRLDTGLEHEDTSGGAANDMLEFNGALVVAGEFNEAGGTTVNRIGQWDGGQWSALPGNGETAPRADAVVTALVEYQGELIVGGNSAFTTVGNSIPVNHIARWNGENWATMSGPDGIGLSSDVLATEVMAMLVHEDALYVGGRFQYAGGVPVHHIARWDGGQWSTLAAGFEGVGMPNRVMALTVFEGDLIAGGNFVQAGGVTVNHIARWTGSEWLPLGTGMNHYVSALAVHNGQLIAAGVFTEAGGASANRIAAWDGAEWSPLGQGVCCANTSLVPNTVPVHDMMIFQGDLIVGGELTQAGGQSVNRIARWDGSAWSSVASGVNSPSGRYYVAALAEFHDALIAAGHFRTAGGVEVSHIARWDGDEWSALAGPADIGLRALTSTVSTNLSITTAVALTTFDGGGMLPSKLAAGGRFAITGGIANQRLGFYGPADLSLEPNPLDLGWTMTGETSIPGTVTLTNIRDHGLSVNSISAPAAPFLHAGGSCDEAPFALAPDESCTLEYHFAPSSADDFSTTVEIDADVPDSPRNLVLHGSGSDTPLAVVPGALDFGMVATGESGGPLEVELINAGPDPVNVDAIDAAQTPFATIPGTCGQAPFELAPAQRCNLSYAFSPAEDEVHNDEILIHSDDAGSPYAVAMTGEGILRALDTAPGVLDFGLVAVGESSDIVSLELSNSGDLPVALHQLIHPGPPFETVQNSCATQLQPQASCTIDYRFSPPHHGVHGDQVVIHSNAPTSPYTAAIQGIGTAPEVALSPLGFSIELVQGETLVQTLNLQNPGNVSLDWFIDEHPMEEQGVLTRPVRSGPPPPTRAAPAMPSGFGGLAISGDPARASYEAPLPAGGVTAITHSNSLDVMSENSIACVAGGTTLENQFLRTFRLMDFGIIGDFHVSEVTFSVQNLTGPAPITINLYTLEGEFIYDNLTLIGSATSELAAQSLTHVTYPISGSALLGATLVVEIQAPDLLGEAVFLPGSNNLGETAPSYIASSPCATDDPVPFSALGAPDVHLVMSVTGLVDPLDCEIPAWMEPNVTQGTIPGGQSRQLQLTIGSAGTGQHEANLCLASNDPFNPVSVVPVALGVSGGPVAEVSPQALTLVAAPGQQASDALWISNPGSEDLLWSIHEAGPDSAGTTVPSRYGYDGNGPIQDSWQEGFVSVSALPDLGWAFVNNTEPAPSASWSQGEPDNFPAHQGPPNSYAAASFLSNHPLSEGLISNWLITPEIRLVNGTELRFWTRAPAGSTKPDRLEVRLSTAGDSIDVGTEAAHVGDFTELLLSINENLESGGYPQNWTEFVITIDGLQTATSGRIAFRYHVPDGGLSGSNADYIGVDTLSITQSPECEVPVDIPWLAVSPDAGVTPAGETDEVGVFVDAQFLDEGEYFAQLCMETNAPAAPLVSIPVQLTVTEGPIIATDPESFSLSMVQDTADTQALSVLNLGVETLSWELIQTVDAGAIGTLPDLSRAVGLFGDIPGFNDLVWAVRSWDSGDGPVLVAGGPFTEVDGMAVSRIAQWDDNTWSALGLGVNGPVNALAVFDGDLIAAGEFTEAGGEPANRIARWDGSQWNPLGLGVNGAVRALTVYDDQLIAIGAFDGAGGNPANFIAAWDGSTWSALGSGLNNGAAPFMGLGVFEGDLYVGGLFSQAGGAPASNIARWDGSQWSALGSGTNAAVTSIAAFDGYLVAGGLFAAADGVADTSRIARWDGSEWSPLGTGMDNNVFSLTVHDDALIASGVFATAGGTPASRVARWDGDDWSALGTGMQNPGNPIVAVRATTPFGGHLIAGGNFTVAGEAQTSHIARWTGESWSAMVPLVADFLVTPEVLNFGTVIAGGSSEAQALTLTNIGNVDVEVLTISEPGAPFEISGGDCPLPPFILAEGQACELEYQFSPTLGGPATASIVIDSDAPSSPHVVALQGAGVACELPQWITLDPAGGNVDGGGAQLTDVELNTTGLAPGGYFATLCLASNDSIQPLTLVPVVLEVFEPAFPVYESVPGAGTALDFGPVTIGTVSAPLGIDAGNSSGQGPAPGSDLQILNAGADHPAFAVTVINDGPFPAGAGPDGKADVEVTCSPNVQEVIAGTLQVDTNDPAQPAGGFIYPLTCEGIEPVDALFSDRFEQAP